MMLSTQVSARNQCLHLKLRFPLVLFPSCQCKDDKVSLICCWRKCFCVCVCVGCRIYWTNEDEYKHLHSDLASVPFLLSQWINHESSFFNNILFECSNIIYAVNKLNETIHQKVKYTDQNFFSFFFWSWWYLSFFFRFNQLACLCLPLLYSTW